MAASSGEMLHLTDEDVNRMKSLGREVCTHVAYSARRTETGRSGVRWNAIGFENQVELFVGEDAHPETDRTLSYMCGVTQVASTINEVADLFNSTSDAHDEFYAHFHQDLAGIDMLASIRGRTRQYPRHMISLKTVTMLSPSATANSRDFVFLESQEDVMDAKRNKRGWVCAMHSIDLPNVPPRQDVVRGSLYRSGFVFTESETPGMLEAIYLLQIDFKGPVPIHVRQAMMKQRIMCLQVLADHFGSDAQSPAPQQAPTSAAPRLGYADDARFSRAHDNSPHQQAGGGNRYGQDSRPVYQSAFSMSDLQNTTPGALVQQSAAPGRSLSGSAASGLQLLGDIHLKPKQNATQCACCVSSFSFLKKKHNCRVCGEVVCSSCCTQQKPTHPIEGIKKFHICTLCTMDNRRSTSRTASSHGGGSKSRGDGRSVLSAGGHKSPKSSLSGTASRFNKQPSGPAAQPAQSRSRVDQNSFEDRHDPELRQFGYGNSKPVQPQAAQTHPAQRNVVMAPPPLPNASMSAPNNFQQSPNGYNGHPAPKQSAHHGYHLEAQAAPRVQPRYNRSTYQDPHHDHLPNNSSYQQSMVSTTSYQIPRYNGTNRPDDPRVSLRDERDSFLNMYDEVGTSVSRAQPVQQTPQYRQSSNHRHLAQPQEVYIPPDAPTTTAVNLGDLKNAPDVLAALNNARSAGGSSGLRLEIIPSGPPQQQVPQQPYPARGRNPHETIGEHDSYSYDDPTPPAATAFLPAPPLPPVPAQQQFAEPNAHEAMRYLPPSISNPQAPPAVESSQMVAQGNAPLGTYVGSRYRIKETRYYAPSPDASPDDYLTQERDSILVDMPSQPQLPAGGANVVANAVTTTAVTTTTPATGNTSPTALTVSKFLDQDIDMFLQPMDKNKKPKQPTPPPPHPLPLDNTPFQQENGNGGNQVSMDDLLMRLHAHQEPPPPTRSPSPPPVAPRPTSPPAPVHQQQPVPAPQPPHSEVGEAADVAMLTRLLVERLQVASDSEREAIRGALTAVQGQLS
ncbi:unnamed protein product [Aphanomyces euteiches]|uniref:FYVE-type domain-containing protein n=1 Tax=Aphanomyces euteiches TaxID=100861 RepID=A0A6G0XD73_9STRA|nr:hypothetical protein Ae201684_006114 [Aphanomyces euteiches]KAH9068793.1 hypothetical protein Ae201684P_004494 [Aphanomyces euteiches]KAH9154192.1 hypothetical protein AeRB84_003678 [Aphanomyces euteiches]